MITLSSSSWSYTDHSSHHVRLLGWEKLKELKPERDIVGCIGWRWQAGQKAYPSAFWLHFDRCHPRLVYFYRLPAIYWPTGISPSSQWGSPLVRLEDNTRSLHTKPISYTKHAVTWIEIIRMAASPHDSQFSYYQGAVTLRNRLQSESPHLGWQVNAIWWQHRTRAGMWT